MQIKKFMAGALSLLMAGASVGFAQNLGQYPQPFVSATGNPDFLVVVGAAAAPSDVVGAIDIAARLGGETGTDVPIPGTSGTVTVSGEGQSIFTTNKKMYFDQHMRRTGLRTSMSDTDLPTLLKSGTVDDIDASTTYDYDLFIDFSRNFSLAYNKISGDLPDPTYFFGEFGTTASTSKYVHRSRIVFNDEVNGTTVVGEKIKLFGGEYTFSSDTTLVATTPKVVLLGSSETRTMAEGEEISITVEGTPHTVTLLVVSDANTIAVDVDGTSKSIDKGNTASVGGVEIFVDDVFFTSKTGTVSSAKIGIGARKLIFTHGQNVKTKVGGESEKTMDGTLVQLSTSSGLLTIIDVYVVGQESNSDFLKVGSTWEDPVWKSFSLSFPSVSSDPMGDDREKIEIKNSGARDIDLIFTNDRNDKGTIKWAHTTSGTDTSTDLADDNGDNISVLEGEAIDRNGYFVLDQGDFSRMFELTSASSLGTTDAQLDIRDVFSGKTIEVKLGSDNATTKVIDGQSYHFNASAVTNDDVNLVVTWGDGSALSAGNRGDFITVWPMMKTKTGLGVAFTEPLALTDLSNGTKIQVPTGAFNVSWISGGSTFNLSVIAVTTEDGEASASATTVSPILNGASRNIQIGRTTTGGINLNITNDGPTSINISLAGAGTTISKGPGYRNATVLFVEEEDDNSNLHTVIFEGGTKTISGTEKTSVNAPVFSYAVSGLCGGSTCSGGPSGASPDSNTDLTRYVDYYGTFVEHDTDDQQTAIVYYPDEQVTANVFILGKDATVSTGGASAGGTVHSSVPVTTSVAKLDGEVTSADKNTKNLILVGGPAVNRLVSDLGTAGKTRTLEDYRTKGDGYALIDLVNDAFVTGKSALVVAGFEAAETRTVSGFLQNFGAHASEFGTKARVEYQDGVLTTSTA